jgi:thiol-disulfide isomerase/thioredoxin
MASQIESVVTPQRFEQGITYKEWMEKIDRNQEKFVDNYDSASLNPDDVEKIKATMAKPNGPAKVLALGEAWCPDVFRGMPVMARLAEATGLDLKIFFRDENLDIMNEFLYKGEFQSIPTFVFYTKDHQYIGHWIEKAKKAREEQPILQQITGKMRDPDLTEEQRKQYMDEYAAFQSGPVWDGWRQAQVAEIRELLEENTK